jgi:hypothetical protein
MSDFDFMGYGQRKRAAFNQFGAKGAAAAHANFTKSKNKPHRQSLSPLITTTG